MIRVDTKSGHGHGKPTSKTIEEITDVYSFLVRSLNLEYKKGRGITCIHTWSSILLSLLTCNLAKLQSKHKSLSFKL